MSIAIELGEEMQYSKVRGSAIILGLLVMQVPFCAGAQSADSVTIFEEYGKLIQRQGAVAALGGELFGDRVSLYTGSLEFVQTDVNLSGNNGLPVSVGRRFLPNQAMANLDGNFADWDLEIPHLHGVFSNLQTWATTGSGYTSYNRCSEFGAPPVEPAQQSGAGGSFAPDEYWQGNFVYIPGNGDEEILIRNPATPAPGDGNSYPLVTRSGAVIRCLPSLDGGSGEGFEVLTTDGTLYRFDHLASRATSQLTKPGGAPILSRSQGSSPPDNSPMAVNDGYLLRRREAWILPTLVTDRMGNTVTYNWDGADGWLLNSMVASDGRSLTFTYVGGTTPHRIATVNDGVRTWTYSYVGDRLAQVTLPDARTWSFDLEPIRFMPGYVEGGSCGSAGEAAYSSRTGTLTHPSGVQGSFTLSPVTMGRSYVPINCLSYRPSENPHSTGFAQYPGETVQAALTSKQISGVGLPAGGMNWAYVYGSPGTCYQPNTFAGEAMGPACNASSPTTRIVVVTGPDDNVRYVFGNRFQVNEGQLLQEDLGWNGTSALRTTVYSYAAPDEGGYPNPIGDSVQTRSDSYLSSRHTPEWKKVTTQQGHTFTRQVATGCEEGYCFDSFARPTNVMKSSSSP